MIQRVLVLGGSNFIGPSLIQALKAEDHEIWILNRGHRLINDTHQLTANREDISQVEACAKLAPKAFDTVFDLSAQSAAHTEIAWTIFSSRSRHWVHLSSSAVYKEHDGKPCPFKETDKIGGATAWGDYGRGKNGAERFLFKKAESASVTILRPPYVYGPNNNNDRETFVWSRLLQGRRIIIPSTGQTKIQFIHVDDLAQALFSAGRTPKTPSIIYNVAAPEVVTLLEWVESLRAIASVKIPVVFGNNGADLGFPPRQYFPFRDLYCVLDTKKITAELPWRPRHSFRSGFESTFASLKIEDYKSKKLNTQIEDQILSQTKMAPCL